MTPASPVVLAIIALNVVVSVAAFRAPSESFLFVPYRVARGENGVGMLLAHFAHGSLVPGSAIPASFRNQTKRNGVERSIPNALSWYRRAADHGDNDSFNRARRLALAMNGEGGLPHGFRPSA